MCIRDRLLAWPTRAFCVAKKAQKLKIVWKEKNDDNKSGGQWVKALKFMDMRDNKPPNAKMKPKVWNDLRLLQEKSKKQKSQVSGNDIIPTLTIKRDKRSERKKA